MLRINCSRDQPQRQSVCFRPDEAASTRRHPHTVHKHFDHRCCGKRCLRASSEPPVKLASPRGGSGERLEGVSGEPLILEVQVSRPGAVVRWLLDGLEIQESANVTITEDGLIRHLSLLSPAPGDSGKYTCDAVDDVMDFPVNVTGEKKRKAVVAMATAIV